MRYDHNLSLFALLIVKFSFFNLLNEIDILGHQRRALRRSFPIGYLADRIWNSIEYEHK